jgi:hypothetical protein
MKFICLQFIFYCCLSICYSQSKKDQILELNNRIDSLNLILEAERNTNTQISTSLNSKINELETQIITLKFNLELKEKESLANQKTILEHNNQIAQLKEVIQRKTDSLEILISETKKNYLDILSKGFTLTDANDEFGQKCSSDFDGDGIEDLIILLFDKESEGRVLIFSSKNFNKTGAYQYFEWIYSGNLLGDFNCDEGFSISGGFESNDASYFEEIQFKWDLNKEKMVVKSYLNSNGETTYYGLKEAVLN